MQCLILFAAYLPSKIKIILPSIIHTEPLGYGIENAPLQNPYNYDPKESLLSENNLTE